MERLKGKEKGSISNQSLLFDYRFLRKKSNLVGLLLDSDLRVVEADTDVFITGGGGVCCCCLSSRCCSAMSMPSNVRQNSWIMDLISSCLFLDVWLTLANTGTSVCGFVYIMACCRSMYSSSCLTAAFRAVAS